MLTAMETFLLTIERFRSFPSSQSTGFCHAMCMINDNDRFYADHDDHTIL